MQKAIIHLAPKKITRKIFNGDKEAFGILTRLNFQLDYHINGFVEDSATYNLRTEPLNISITHR
jgi:hypothetical protein